MLKHWLRSWLGITDLSVDIDRVYNRLHDELLGIRSDLTVTFSDEFDPKRKEMSAKLGAKAIARLEGEDKARRHTTGEL